MKKNILIIGGSTILFVFGVLVGLSINKKQEHESSTQQNTYKYFKVRSLQTGKAYDATPIEMDYRKGDTVWINKNDASIVTLHLGFDDTIPDSYHFIIKGVIE